VSYSFSCFVIFELCVSVDLHRFLMVLYFQREPSHHSSPLAYCSAVLFLHPLRFAGIDRLPPSATENRPFSDFACPLLTLALFQIRFSFLSFPALIPMSNRHVFFFWPSYLPLLLISLGACISARTPSDDLGLPFFTIFLRLRQPRPCLP